MNDLLCLKWNNHSSTLLKKLKAIYSKDIFCDVTIACHGRYYPVHKLILSVCSEYFEEIFRQTQCKHPFLILKDIGPNELEALLSYMYNGEVNVPQESLPGLIKAAEALQIKGLAVSDDGDEEESDKPKSKKRKLEHSSLVRMHKSQDSVKQGPTDSKHGERRTNDKEKADVPGESPNEINNIKIEALDSVDEERVEDGNVVTNCEDYEIPNSIESSGLRPLGESPSRLQLKEENVSASETVAQCSSWDETWSRDSNIDTSHSEMCETNVRIGPEEYSSTLQEDLSRGDINQKQSTGNTVYECCYCSFKSYSKTTWRNHCYEKHPGNDLFSCKVCRYQTNLKYLLNRHMYVHNGEKKYKCHLCSYKTAYSFNMKTHYHKHNISFQ